MNPSNYFDIYDFFFNEIVGAPFLAFLIGFILLITYSIRKNTAPEVTISLSVLWSMCFVALTGNMLVYTLTLVLGGTFYYYAIAQKWRSG